MYIFSARVLEDLRLLPLCVCAPRRLCAPPAGHRSCALCLWLQSPVDVQTPDSPTGGTTLITCTETITLHYITLHYM